MAADPPSDETLSQLMPAVYGELRQLARYYMGRERAPQTIQATALVHEAYLRLAKDGKHDWQGRGHFKAIAAIAMRRILVERARAKAASKRGGSRARITLDEALVADDGRPSDLLALDDALTRLAKTDAQQARIGRASFLRRSHGRRNSGGLVRFARHGQARVGRRARLASPGAGQGAGGWILSGGAG